jgi:hypothetical protein
LPWWEANRLPEELRTQKCISITLGQDCGQNNPNQILSNRQDDRQWLNQSLCTGVVCTTLRQIHDVEEQ